MTIREVILEENKMEILLGILAGVVEIFAEGIAENAIEKRKQKKKKRQAKKISVLIEKIKNIDYQKIVKIVITKNKALFYYRNARALKLKFAKINGNITSKEIKEALVDKLHEEGYAGELIVK